MSSFWVHFSAYSAYCSHQFLSFLLRKYKTQFTTINNKNAEQIGFSMMLVREIKLWYVSMLLKRNII